MSPSEGSAATTIPARAWIEKDRFLVHPGLSAAGLSHGVTTRALGNMKDESRRREAAAILGAGEPLTLKQVHGTKIFPAALANLGQEGDGWTVGPGDEGVCVAVYVADCVPLYLWSEDGLYAGIFHAGWKGLAAGMATGAVEALAARGAEPRRLQAALGPHIGVSSYIVGAELARSFSAQVLPRRSDGLRLDLYAETRRQLRSAGLAEGSIAPAAPCTASHPDLFYSFRRDKQDARMLALLFYKRSPS
ncbi:MAG: polyphenol oxidase family protein [Elusimicrobiota bacterium]